MDQNRPYFFCGIGGSGMLPLALILRAKGHAVSGSDRALDQGRTSDKFAFLRARRIELFPQDGSGVTNPDSIVVASAAVEDTVPDVKAARTIGAELITRAQLLAKLFNAAPKSIGIAGTSGKTTTTGMIGWILNQAGLNPTIVNGGVMKNFVTPEMPFANAVAGGNDLFVCEVDESDGSIAYYTPRIAVLNNIALDHKSMDELRTLFRDFVSKAKIAVVNIDNAETKAIAEQIPHTITYSFSDVSARLLASNLSPGPDTISFDVRDREGGVTVPVPLRVPGKHNVANALAAMGAALACGVPIEKSAKALAGFVGIGRRFERVGATNDITVIDDFAHNPDKIEATLATLHAAPGRLLIMFQPQGYGPLRKMKQAFIDCFARNMGRDDVLVMPEPIYFGGTVDRSISSGDIVRGVVARERHAFALVDREACGEKLLELALPGDSIVVMGARDDTLSEFAFELLRVLRARPEKGKRSGGERASRNDGP